jgi:hypothetical protein
LAYPSNAFQHVKRDQDTKVQDGFNLQANIVILIDMRTRKGHMQATSNTSLQQMDFLTGLNSLPYKDSQIWE